MRPHCTSEAFLGSLQGFVAAVIAGNERQRRQSMRHRQLLSEIAWCRNEISRLETVARRRPSVHRQVAELVHQIRQKELEIAFLG